MEHPASKDQQNKWNTRSFHFFAWIITRYEKDPPPFHKTEATHWTSGHVTLLQIYKETNTSLFFKGESLGKSHVVK